MFIQSKDNKHLIVLSRGEKIMESLTKAASELDIAGGLISGIGAVENLELGFYNLGKKDYHRKHFTNGEYELLQLSGNISLKEDKPFVHVHVTCSDESFQAFGGHMFEGEVAVTAEIYITPLGVMPVRNMDSQVGLHTICGIQ